MADERGQHEPNVRAANSALAIYESAESAQRLLSASPLRFQSGSGASVSVRVPSSGEEEEEEGGPAPAEGPGSALEDCDEVDAAGLRPDVAPGQGSAFTGLRGTVRAGSMHPSPKNRPAATGRTPSRAPKTFDHDPTALEHSHPDLQKHVSDILQNPTPSDGPREFRLEIERSTLDHYAYIQRQHYYGHFPLDLKSLMAEDLHGRVPVNGMADCELGKQEVPFRIRAKRREEEDRRVWTSLGRLWEQGERAREKEALEEAAREEVGGDIVDIDFGDHAKH